MFVHLLENHLARMLQMCISAPNGPQFDRYGGLELAVERQLWYGMRKGRCCVMYGLSRTENICMQ